MSGAMIQRPLRPMLAHALAVTTGAGGYTHGQPFRPWLDLSVGEAMEALAQRGVMPFEWVGDPSRAFSVDGTMTLAAWRDINAPNETFRSEGSHDFVITISSTLETWPRRTVTLSREGHARSVQALPLDGAGDTVRLLTRAWPEPRNLEELTAWISVGAPTILRIEMLARAAVGTLDAQVVWWVGRPLNRATIYRSDEAEEVRAEGFEVAGRDEFGSIVLTCPPIPT